MLLVAIIVQKGSFLKVVIISRPKQNLIADGVSRAERYLIANRVESNLLADTSMITAVTTTTTTTAAAIR